MTPLWLLWLVLAAVASAPVEGGFFGRKSSDHIAKVESERVDFDQLRPTVSLVEPVHETVPAEPDSVLTFLRSQLASELEDTSLIPANKQTALAEFTAQAPLHEAIEASFSITTSNADLAYLRIRSERTSASDVDITLFGAEAHVDLPKLYRIEEHQKSKKKRFRRTKRWVERVRVPREIETEEAHKVFSILKDACQKALDPYTTDKRRHTEL